MSIVDYLSSEWRNSGLEDGDTVLIHSSLKSTMHRLKNLGYVPDLSHIFDSFRYVVGKDGTLIFPLFNFEFTKGDPFIFNQTRSHMGALTEYARNFKNSVRTGHPIYSFAVIGKNASHFDGLINESGYGHDSPFAVLKELDGKIGILGLPENSSMTFYHYVEECLAVDYRYIKNFTGQYTDNKGITGERTFKLFVRDIEKNIETQVDPMGERLWSLGKYKGCRHKDGNYFRTIKAIDVFNETKKIIQSGKALGHLYEISNEIDDKE